MLLSCPDLYLNGNSERIPRRFCRAAVLRMLQGTLQLTKFISESEHYLTMWYHSFSGTAECGDELELTGFRTDKNLHYISGITAAS
jgi:hypothetical protein